MTENKNIELKIIPKPEYISWEDITELLHSAYAEKAEKGMNYLATHQDSDTTRKRVGDGVCFVAVLGQQLIGTVTFRISDVKKSNKKWYNKNRYGIITQLAVLPGAKGSGIGKRLVDKLVDISKDQEVDELICDTSIKATQLLSWWKRQGFEFIGLLSYPFNNYYSIQMRRNLTGKKFNKTVTKIKYFNSALKCYILKTKDGRIRKVWNLYFNR